MEIEIKRKNSSVIIPEYKTDGSVGLDLHTYALSFDIPPFSQVIVPTGVSINIKDPNVMGMIVPRSSVGSRGLVLGNGTGIIDSDYQGEIKLVLYNRTSEPVWLEEDERVAQLIFVPIIKANFKEVLEFSNTTERGVGGFGSTGK